MPTKIVLSTEQVAQLAAVAFLNGAINRYLIETSGKTLPRERHAELLVEAFTSGLALLDRDHPMRDWVDAWLNNEGAEMLKGFDP